MMRPPAPHASHARHARRSHAPAADGRSAPGRRSGPEPCAGSGSSGNRNPPGFNTPSGEAHRAWSATPRGSAPCSASGPVRTRNRTSAPARSRLHSAPASPPSRSICRPTSGWSKIPCRSDSRNCPPAELRSACPCSTSTGRRMRRYAAAAACCGCSRPARSGPRTAARCRPESAPPGCRSRHVRIVDAHAVKHAQQVLGGRDQHALPHQAGRVAHPRHMPPTGRQSRNSSRSVLGRRSPFRRSRLDPDRPGHAAVEPHPRSPRAVHVVSKRKRLSSMPHVKNQRPYLTDGRTSVSGYALKNLQTSS
jgi:hypothetical protein